MGFCHEDTGPLVGIESRGESFRLFNLADTEHIFAFENGNVEITYEFLAAFLTRLQEPEIRKALLKGDGSPAEGERTASTGCVPFWHIKTVCDAAYIGGGKPGDIRIAIEALDAYCKRQGFPLDGGTET